MTNFENIKNVKQLLNSEAKYNSVAILAKDSGASYYYIKALIETNIISKLNSRYVWLKEEEPNIRTFKKLRDIASRIKREINSKPKRVVSHQVTAGNGITINFSNGKAVVRRNGRSIECDDLQSVESLIKFIS
jgi:hypothetical protein